MAKHDLRAEIVFVSFIRVILNASFLSVPPMLMFSLGHASETKKICNA